MRKEYACNEEIAVIIKKLEKANNLINSEILERKVIILNSNGLHARPATKFMQIANKFNAEILVKTMNKEVDGKNVIDLLTLGARRGTEIVISAKGSQASEALDALEELVKGKFGEE